MSATADGFGERTVPVRPLDEEQARLLEILTGAGGGPVSFDELRARGIENPATLAYELEIAGLAIEQVQRPQLGGPSLQLRVPLEPAWLESATRGGRRPAAGERIEARPPHDPERQHPRLGVRGPVLAGAVAATALAALAVVLVVALGGSSANHGAGRVRIAASTPAGRGARGQTPGADNGAATRPAHAGSAGTHTSAGATDAGANAPGQSDAAELQTEGHRMLEEGSYSAAVGKLRAAVDAGAQSPQQCAEPTTRACLTYAYALYDLGRALQLDDDPAAAVTVLSERLRIDDQRAVVRQQLAAARQQLQPAPPEQEPSRSSHNKPSPAKPGRQAPPAGGAQPGGTAAPAPAPPAGASHPQQAASRKGGASGGGRSGAGAGSQHGHTRSAQGQGTGGGGHGGERHAPSGAQEAVSGGTAGPSG